MNARTVSMASALLAASALVGGAASAQNPSGISWSTYFGGSAKDSHNGNAVVVAPNGNILVAGHSTSPGLSTNGAFQPTYAGAGSSNKGDAYVARLDPSQNGSAQLVWCTYLGGRADETVFDIVVHPSGDILVSGWTESSGFPTTPGVYQRTLSGVRDGYVARIRGDGTQLIWSTLLGAEGTDVVSSLALGTAGELFVAGNTDSVWFPIKGSTPYQTTRAGLIDGFVAVFDPSARGFAQLLRSTYLGGTGYDYCKIALDSAGSPVLSGRTTSPNFPTTTNAFQPAFGGHTDGWISRLDSQLTQLTYSTYLGGSQEDHLRALALAPGDQIAVGGYTLSSTNFPVSRPYDSTHNGGRDGFVALLDTQQPKKDQLVWSTYLGGSGHDVVVGLAVERCGLVTISGETGSTALPTTAGAHAVAYRGGTTDAFVARFDPGASGAAQLHYASYLGGTAAEEAAAATLDAAGSAVLVGRTLSLDFPTTQGAYQTSLAGGKDLFVTRLTMLPQGAQRYGSSTAACPWPIYQGVNSMPAQNNPGFAVHVCGAPPTGLGAAFIGFRSPVAVPVFNIGLLLNPGLPILTVPTPTNTLGHAQLPLPLAGLPPGTQFALQWVFFTTMSCSGTGPFAASNGLEITV